MCVCVCVVMWSGRIRDEGELTDRCQQFTSENVIGQQFGLSLIGHGNENGPLFFSSVGRLISSPLSTWWPRLVRPPTGRVTDAGYQPIYRRWRPSIFSSDRKQSASASTFFPILLTIFSSSFLFDFSWVFFWLPQRPSMTPDYREREGLLSFFGPAPDISRRCSSAR